ncbi:MAG TPA: hypothetical protein VMT00_04885 [Thermoanaerobaculia bacterium]|nr:hypothetical protein [Thermoanaerobaculia bacterium]
MAADGRVVALEGGMARRWDARELAARAAAFGTVWAVRSLLKVPKAQELARKGDRAVSGIGRELDWKLRRVRENARTHPAYLIGGLTAIAVGLAMLTRSSVR